MGFLDRFFPRRAPTRPRRGQLRVESRNVGRPWQRLSRKEWVFRGLIFLALVVLAVLAFRDVSVYRGGASVGDIWQSEDVVAPFDFSILIPEEEIEAMRDSVARAEPRIFYENPEALEQTLGRLDSVKQEVDSTAAAFWRWQSAPDSLPRLAAQDSAEYMARRMALAVGLTRDEWAILIQSRRDSPQFSLIDVMVRVGSEVARQIHERGVLDISKDSIPSATIAVRDPDPNVRTERRVDLSNVFDSVQVEALAEAAYLDRFPSVPDTLSIAMKVFQASFEPSLIYQREATLARVAQRVGDIQPNRGQVREGSSIIRRGDEVTQERFDMLRSLERAQAERSGNISILQTIFGRTLLAGAALLVFFLYLFLIRGPIFGSMRLMLLIGMILGITIVGFWIAGLFGGSVTLIVPVSLASILLAVIFDSRLGSFATFTLAMVGGLALGYDFQTAFAYFFAGFVAVFSVRDVKTRSQLLGIAGLVWIALMVTEFGFALLRADPFGLRFLEEGLMVTIHAALILVAAPALYGLERAFGVTTDLTLLELSDTNRPVLRELSLRAPGTFNHSLQVANLAEAATNAIGGNAMRARVGALYHDIGKMLKPEYFVENQHEGENPHEDITPHMSALILGSHVKDGIELGNENGLPKMVLDFISTHHGTGRMDFFYHKALEEGEDEKVDENDFRYPGPRPQSVEQAIVMLADSVEAASRSLRRPTPRRLQSLLDDIFKARVDDDQLDTSSLTFSDLTTIKEVFHGILSGIYHIRVKYPGQEEEEKVEFEGEAGKGEEEAGEPFTPARGLDVPLPSDPGGRAQRDGGQSYEAGDA